jgi:hypothetical protein
MASLVKNDIKKE